MFILVFCLLFFTYPVESFNFTRTATNNYSSNKYGLSLSDVAQLWGWLDDSAYPDISPNAWGVTSGGQDLNAYGLPTWYANRIDGSGDVEVWWLTDGAYQSMVQVSGQTAVIVDCPPSLSTNFGDDGPISRFLWRRNLTLSAIIYTHSHVDHISGCAAVLADATRAGSRNVLIVSTEEVAESLSQTTARGDKTRPQPNFIVGKRTSGSLLRRRTCGEALAIPGGSNIKFRRFELDPHSPGDLIVYFENVKTVFAVDVVYPGWVPWQFWAFSDNLLGYTEGGNWLLNLDLPWSVLVGGHVGKLGSREDVNVWIRFINDTIKAMGEAIQDTFSFDLNDIYLGIGGRFAAVGQPQKINWWAVYKRFLDVSAFKCIEKLRPVYGKDGYNLAAFETYSYTHCMSARNYLQDTTNLWGRNIPGASAKRGDLRFIQSLLMK